MTSKQTNSLKVPVVTMIVNIIVNVTMVVNDIMVITTLFFVMSYDVV
jgi:hypothetical protein